MKSLKRTIKDFKENTHGRFVGWLKPKVGAFGKRHRIGARIRLANNWAVRHPKKTFAYTVGALLAVLICDIAVTGLKAENDMPGGNVAIANMEPIFNGFRTIQSNKESHRRELDNLAMEGKVVKLELDSLIRLSDKSHEDSLRIIHRYNRLSNIVKSLNNNDNEEN